MGVVGQSHAVAALPILREVGWAPRLVWTRAEDLALDPRVVQPRSESPYRLDYPGPHVRMYKGESNAIPEHAMKS